MNEETRRTYGTSLRARTGRAQPRPVADGVAGRAGKDQRRTPAMNDVGQSDRLMVPAKPTNKPSTTATKLVPLRSAADDPRCLRSDRTSRGVNRLRQPFHAAAQRVGRCRSKSD